MRRTSTAITALAATLATALLTGLLVPTAAADDLPPGFRDGRPVGEEPTPGEPVPEPAPAPSSSAGTAAATERYFGSGAFTAVQQAVAGTARSCPISNDGLTALVLAPVFAESSAATTASTAPSPMTLSRYDEWNGVFSTSMGTPENNYGLYAFSEPSTAYKRAFWHPGLGIWQYDTAGLGAPLTTVEAMDVRVVAGAVASEIARRYCAATGDDEARRHASWSPWNGCSTGNCETFFQEMFATTPKFANLNLVSGIGPLGGVSPRDCVVENQTMPCWYVDPRVGVIQGSSSWATLSPLDGGSPTVAPTPISLPFYVVDRGATEERHWMRFDTGYDIDIRAVRNIGRDARPRSTQPGSGLAWSSSSTLCDISAGRGPCVPVPPPGVSTRPISAGPGYRPVALDADGDDRGDVLWYKPGSGSDYLWLGRGAGTFSSVGLSVGGTFDDVLAGDVDGDGDDDVLWYVRSSGASYLWRSNGDGTFSSTGLSPGAGRRPILLDSNGDGDEEIFWYGPGTVPDAQWSWNGAGFSVAARSVGGSYIPVIGDFDRNGRDDVFWYAPGGASDHLWLHAGSGAIVSVSKKVSGYFTPVVANLDGDGFDDIVWYAPGQAGDYTWFGAPGGGFASAGLAVNGWYIPIAADLRGTGRDTVIWYAKGPAQDYEHSWSPSRAISVAERLLPSQHTPVVGRYATGGADGVVWYEPDLATDVIWYR